MKNKKILWKILLLIGLIPFISILIYGIYVSITGFSLLCILNCAKEYGFIAFRDSIISISYIIWPIYIIGLLLITLSIFKLKRNSILSINKGDFI